MRTLVMLMAAIALAVAAKEQPLVIPWMCLERCGFNESTILPQISWLQQWNNVTRFAAYERFDLGPNSTLIVNNFSDVSGPLAAIGVGPIAMITTVRLSWMRQLFANPHPFIDAVLNQLIGSVITGVNIDFEPNVNGDFQDATNFAKFLSHFAERLAAYNKTLSVDIAQWNGVWNYQLLSKSRVWKIATMETYATNDTLFLSRLENATETFTPQQLLVGLWHRDPPNAFNPNEVALRFDALRDYGICSVAIWDMPLGPVWTRHLNELVKRCS